MKRWRQVLNRAEWTAVSLAVAFALGCGPWGVRYNSPRYTFWLGLGSVGAEKFRRTYGPPSLGWECVFAPQYWSAPSLDWRPMDHSNWHVRYRGVWWVHVSLPYATLLCAALAVALHVAACRLRPRPGRCECGYDLTGNTTGRCPECGQDGHSSTAMHR